SSDLMTTCTRGVTGFDIALSGFFSSIGIWPHEEVTDVTRQESWHALAMLETSDLAYRFTDERSSGVAPRILLSGAPVPVAQAPRPLAPVGPVNALNLIAQRVRQLSRIMHDGSRLGVVRVTRPLSSLIARIERVMPMSQGPIAADGLKAEVLTACKLSEFF